MQVKIELYALREYDGGLVSRVVSHETQRFSLSAMYLVGDIVNCSVFTGPARELQAWAAKRNIPYQHVTLNVPVELEI
jgi:hypothetical protein